ERSDGEPAGSGGGQSPQPEGGADRGRRFRILASACRAACRGAGMLMMARRQGETILIGEEIEVVIAHIGRSRVKVGIRAPRAMPVMAREVKLVQEENRRAAERSARALSSLRPGDSSSAAPGR